MNEVKQPSNREVKYLDLIAEVKLFVNRKRVTEEYTKPLVELRRLLKLKFRMAKEHHFENGLCNINLDKVYRDLLSQFNGIKPADWDYHQEQVMLYKQIRGDEYMREFKNKWTDGDEKPFKLDHISQEDIDKHKDVDGKVKSNGK